MTLKKKSKLGTFLLVSLIAGIVIGQIIHMTIKNPADVKAIIDVMDVLSGVFLRLIKMIIAPLVFATLVSGIAKLGDSTVLGRLFLRSMFIFIVGGFLALILGIILIEVFQPGKALHDVLLSGRHANIITTANVCTTCKMTLKSFIESIVPSSVVEGFVNNHILQVVLFAVLFGISGVALGKKVQPLFDFFDMVSQIMFKVTAYIMLLAPVAVFTSVASLVMGSGISVISYYLVYLLEFYLGLLILWGLIIVLGLLVVGKRIFILLKSIAGLCGLAFAASSSEVVLPSLVLELEKFGISTKISGFVLPLGYSFNLLASMLNCTFATMFIIQLYGFHITFAQEITMLLMLMITSKGIAGVPRVSLVIVAATLAAFGFPEAGVLILFPVDGFLDMGRSATNVFANAMATVFVDRWERKQVINVK